MATSLTLQNDTSLQQGYIKVNGTTAATITTSGIQANLTGNVTGNADTATKLSTTTGSAPAYACRAWVNFDGTKDTTGAASTANTNRLIRASGNVTSVLRNTAGDYTINLTTPMSDANYASLITSTYGSSNSLISTQTISTIRVSTYVTTTGGNQDQPLVSVAIFGN